MPSTNSPIECNQLEAVIGKLERSIGGRFLPANRDAMRSQLDQDVADDLKVAVARALNLVQAGTFWTRPHADTCTKQLGLSLLRHTC